MRSIFCGNFEYDARQTELERLFKRYGRVERVDMKAGFAFVYMEDERDAEDAIRGLDRVEFGRKGRRLHVEWTKQERGVRRPGGTSRRSANSKPSKTLFVINFDPHHTRTKDLERHFEPYGKIVSARIRRNFAFVQYDAQEDATKALDATNMSKLLDRVIAVEYAARDDGERRDGYSPDRSRDRSPDRRGHDRRSSPSPYRKERGSADYGRGPSPYRKERGSPDSGHRRSPSPYRRERGSPDYGRGSTRSPSRRERAGSDHGHGPSHGPYRKDDASPVKANGRGDNPYPREERHSPENGRVRSRSPYGRERSKPDNDRGSSRSPLERDGSSPENGQWRSPSSNPDKRDSAIGRVESPRHERYHSQSPAADE
ncbi:serine/arginine-rich splicing factor RS [Salix suchowensis]|nr:serine/arginine-rich splicing factor RS [Salix suchowensis]